MWSTKKTRVLYTSISDQRGQNENETKEDTKEIDLPKLGSTITLQHSHRPARHKLKTKFSPTLLQLQDLNLKL